ncbi:hypothetical protein ASG40_14895 [Methylobacterium sp. Leaf399]|uniref:hypothetical protein n=1 Tax=unclassified Methylobacterium TaxID=2615210 RepID=UPI0006FCEE8B|nr:MULTISPECIES: hypothetical protein [unclassified Methylobacterium]KQP50273.1 hypothetical protein ASF39_13240 [Methylobacterium sp. Leaf108]KQT07272.1 hypothetical protein ASG40_14895 [Methylobacterium sp. Leaf399]KQT76887.1 hypothetical protein ASG59_13040 [Methylobacterium sp. Leaf466]
MASTTTQGHDTNQPELTVQVESPPTMTGHTRAHLGVALRTIYADLCEAQPITDTQVDLLLRLRHKERDRRRAA